MADYFCRLMRFMDRHDYDAVVPQAPPDGPGDPIIDLQAGYVLRALDRLPRQGKQWPWRLRQNYPWTW